ncbi:MAG: efflux RND transporter permease subunit [Planctomycetaceae bacterium]
MIERIIELSIRNRFLVLILAAAMTVAGVYALFNTPIDAIPDLSETQVIVFTDWMGRSPREVEDQITYPLSLKLQGLAGVKAVRSSSEFNFSMITIIFEDGIDFYFARQRVTEKLSQAGTFLPAGVVPYLAPDATALGQVFWYTVEPGPDNPIDTSRLWALNKFYIAPQLNGGRRFRRRHSRGHAAGVPGTTSARKTSARTGSLSANSTLFREAPAGRRRCHPEEQRRVSPCAASAGSAMWPTSKRPSSRK